MNRPPAESYDELPLWSAPFGLMLLDTIRLKRGIRVLDIGSGHGFPMLEVADRISPEGTVTGLEPQDEAIRIINSKISGREIRNATVVQGFAEDMPFDDGQFDLITSNNGLNNVRDQEASFGECYRVAMPGAQLVATMNLPHTMTEFYELFDHVLHEKGLMRESDLMSQHIASKRKPVEFLKRLILQTGFELQSINLDGFKYTFTGSGAVFGHYLIRNFFLPSWVAILPPDLGKEVFRDVGERIDTLCKNEGCFTLSIPYVCFDCRKPARTL